MRTMILAFVFGLFSLSATAFGQTENPSIDMEGYLRTARDAAKHRESRRVSEEEFIKLGREPGVVILDARSKEKFNELHIAGAINISFPDITVASLQSILLDKKTRILIYCNNNFKNAESPFPAKMATASLNISTYISLYTYGYRNVYELGPLLDITDTKLDLVSTRKPDKSIAVAELKGGN